MKEALLLAKGLAQQQGMDEITQEKFLGALHFFEINGRKSVVRKLLALRQEYVGQIKQTPPLSIQGLIEDARKAAPIPLAKDLKKLLKHLSANSISILLKYEGEKTVLRPPGLLTAERIKRTLESGLKGQASVVSEIASYLALRGSGSGRKNGIQGAFIFAGPPASGKSMAANLLVEGLGDYHLWSYDCSSISSVHERGVFDGSPSNIMGSKPGELTDFVRLHPKTVIVLEHFDKMATGVQDFLLSLLETGFVKDMFGFYEDVERKTIKSTRKIAEPEVDFRSTYLILTVESGAELYESTALIERLRAEGGETQVRSALMASLAAAKNEKDRQQGPCFAPSVLSRLAADGLPLLFQPIGWQALRTICRDELRAAFDLMRRHMKAVQIQIDEGEIEQLVTLLILVEGGQADPRRINREKLVERIFGNLNSSWLCGAAVLPRIEINLGNETVADLADILAELGDEPVRRLFREMRRLIFDQELIDTVEGGITMISFRNPRLVKASIGGDFQGSGALLIEVPELRLDDVAGQEPIKAKLRRQASLLRDNRMLSSMGLRPPGGMLLFGLPGTGKTLLARAFAGETGFPFLAVTGAELMDLSFQKKLFEKLRRYAPAVLFVDEIDVLGRRGGGLDPAINTLLSELDGFSSKNGEPLFVIGATNLKQKIDPALLRPGRMELVFEVKPPDRAARRFLFQRVVTRLAFGVSEELIDYSCGMTGAQIEAACREIVLMDQFIDDQTARKVLEEQMFGELITDLDQELYETIAYHEAGHAVAMIVGGFRVSYVSLTAREGRAGHVWAELADARFTQNATTTRATIAAILAGRVAQCIHHGDDRAGDSGAAEDLRSATRMAYVAIGQLGLDPEIGLVSLPKEDEDGFTMPFLAQQVEKKVTIWLTDAEQEARSLLIQNWPAVEAIAGELLKTGALAHTRLAEVMKHAPTITNIPAGRSSKED